MYIGMTEERKPLWASFWAFTGEFGDPLSNYDLFADIWMWIYAFFTTVVMVILLVAMMANTYEVVKENALVVMPDGGGNVKTERIMLNA